MATLFAAGCGEPRRVRTRTLHIGADDFSAKYLLPDRWGYFASADIGGFPAIVGSDRALAVADAIVRRVQG
ncbi:hypothetical protein ACFQV2_23555 [Actinokineospora soli]|uniref:Uncharacterized protein n=1 Tax=Actinokineospora soli TaxID=1048753 RepID=A0ABW2TT76_9PSEU